MIETTYEKGKLYNINLDKLFPDPNQPRKFFDLQELEDLQNSILHNGLIHPIIFRKGEDGKFFVVAGERRYRAFLNLGMKAIPATFTDGNAAEIALIENLQRSDLTPIEESEALLRMRDECKYKDDRLAEMLGKSRSTISEMLSLNKLPEEIKAKCRYGTKYPRRILVEIAKFKTKEEMIEKFNLLETQGLTRDEIRQRKKGNAPEYTPITYEDESYNVETSKVIKNFENSIKATRTIATKLKDDLQPKMKAKLIAELQDLLILLNETTSA